MKNKVIILTVIIFFIGIFFIADIEGFEDLTNSISIKNIDIIDNKEFEKIKVNREESIYELAEIKYKDDKIPYDTKEKIYYFAESNKGDSCSIFYGANTTLKCILNNDKSCIKIIAYNKYKYKTYNIVLTKLPLINIELNENYKNISENYVYGKISILNNTNNDLIIKTDDTIKIKVRGGYSRNYDKKSYTIKFIDSSSGNDIIKNNILNLKSNNAYALNSLYEDESKIRDTLSNQVWGEICEDKNQQVEFKYVEAIINGEYYGLYGLEELLTEHKFDWNSNEIIYKINSDKFEKYNNLKENINYLAEITYPQKSKDKNFNPLIKLLKIIYYSDNETFSKSMSKSVDINNFVDNFILLELTYNMDGLFKNNVLQYNRNTGIFTRIPWDLDMTWGKTMGMLGQPDSDIELSKQLLYKNGNYFTNVYLEKRLWENNVGNFRQKVAKRWKELRGGFLETESFVNYANSLYDEVTESGAREREHKRWPKCGYSTDNSFIDTFIRQRLPYLDEQFLKYLDDSGEN